MTDAAKTLLPIYAFMLIPLWIPIIAIVAGWLLDLVKPRKDHPVVAQLRARRHAARFAERAAQTA
jgi:hypothetical protein